VPPDPPVVPPATPAEPVPAVPTAPPVGVAPPRLPFDPACPGESPLIFVGQAMATSARGRNRTGASRLGAFILAALSGPHANPLHHPFSSDTLLRMGLAGGACPSRAQAGSTRTATTVMLSTPPFLLASPMSFSQRASRSGSASAIADMSSSLIMPE